MPETVRILVVAPLPPPIGGDTITSKRLIESRYWESAGFEVACIDTSTGEGVRTSETRRSWKDPLRAIRIMWQLAFRLPRADFVLLWANSSFIVSLGIPVMRLVGIFGRPYIVKPFGSMLADRIDEAGPWRRRSIVSLLNKAEHVLPETRMHADELTGRSGIDPERIVLFPNMIPDDLIPAERPERKFSGRCIYIGQVKAEKGIFDIIEALRDRKEFSCDFYGQILDRDNERFFREIDSCPSCRYMGTLQSEKIVETLGTYDVLLLPTYHQGEGYPAVILEAFAAGVPVITTEWKAIPELVKDGESGILIQPSSPGQITAALDLLGRDERLYESLAEKAHQYIRDFSEENLIGNRLTGLITSSVSVRPKTEKRSE
jgi:glycosyltransferase involved in cell wall biosynthesis